MTSSPYIRLTVRVSDPAYTCEADGLDGDQFYYWADIPENLPTSIICLIALGLLASHGWVDVAHEIYLEDALFITIT